MRILIVDDDLSNLALMRTMLSSHGYDVKQAVNGEKALEILKAEDFDLIISDILMPVMDGYHLCQECKADPHLKNIPFIFCSGTYTDKKDENLSIKFGAEAFIAKPFHNEQLLMTISQVMENFSRGQINTPSPQNDDNKEVYKLYSERLVKKLEEKMLALDKEKMALEMEVAERIKIEERLRKSRNFEESLLNAAPGIMLILDTEGCIVRFNPYMEVVSGYSLKDVKGQYWADVFSPENGSNHFLMELPPHSDLEIPMGNMSSIITKTGEKRQIMWFDSTLKDENGKNIGLLAVGQDITRQVELQKKIIREKTDKALRKFSENFIKEINEITAAMLENITRLEKEMGTAPEHNKHLKEIKKYANRAKDITLKRLPEKKKS